MRKIVRSLPCKLSIEELQTRGTELASLCTEQEKTHEDKKDLDRGLNEKIKGLAADITATARILGQGQEFRDVECVERVLWESNTIEIWRRDTNERVQVRTMTAEEKEAYMQEDLPGVEDGAPEGQAKQ